MSIINFEKLGEDLSEYCDEYIIPIDYIFNILNDQKVLPMIRGKATEYNLFVLLTEILNRNEWSVDKLNLNPQPGRQDEDISVTHKRTGIIVKLESKNAVRGSAKFGSPKTKIKVPHCMVKCHRSRSNTKKLDSGNDRYTADSFDIIVTNISNSIIESSSINKSFQLISDKNMIDFLSKLYDVPANYRDLFIACSNDWRFVIAKNIAEESLIPRTPALFLENDKNWKSISEIENSLLEIVKEKAKNNKTRRTNS
ncbi:MAG: hypothetical protein FWD71_02160 [Oscillospiraceae bacterium]|nr:hypothetical protein [Oscillospiraceae bacterium]